MYGWLSKPPTTLSQGLCPANYAKFQNQGEIVKNVRGKDNGRGRRHLAVSSEAPSLAFRRKKQHLLESSSLEPSVTNISVPPASSLPCKPKRKHDISEALMNRHRKRRHNEGKSAHADSTDAVGTPFVRLSGVMSNPASFLGSSLDSTDTLLSGADLLCSFSGLEVDEESIGAVPRE